MMAVLPHMASEHEVSSPLAYTDAEVSSLLHVSKRTVYRLRKSGVLRFLYIRRAVRVPADALSQFLSSGLQKTKQEQKGNENAGQNPSVQPKS